MATLDLYSQLIHAIEDDKAISEARHILINNLPVPNLFQQPDGFIREYLAKQTRLLEDAGAVVIGVCCNSAHHFFQSMQAAVTDRVLLVDLIQEVCSAVKEAGFRRPGIMSSTMARPLYEAYSLDSQLEPVMLDATEQERVDAAISRILHGDRGAGLVQELNSIAACLAGRGADCIILGCTDLPLVMTESSCPHPLISSTAVLADSLNRYSRSVKSTKSEATVD